MLLNHVIKQLHAKSEENALSSLQMAESFATVRSHDKMRVKGDTKVTNWSDGDSTNQTVTDLDQRLCLD